MEPGSLAREVRNLTNHRQSGDYSRRCAHAARAASREIPGALVRDDN
jgi:hypothetical protein